MSMANFLPFRAFSSSRRIHSLRAFSTALEKAVAYNRDLRIPQVLSKAIECEYLCDASPIAMFLDLDQFRQRCDDLKSCFRKVGVPDDSITHTYAVKALPLPRLLNEAHSFGFGAEAASKGEIDICLQLSDIDTTKIIFDSPCKTSADLEYCLNNNLSFNLDNLQELQRLASLVEQTGEANDGELGVNVGFRVNPVVGMGSIAVTSTATSCSKFGINMEQFEDEISYAYKQYPWLNMIHCHVGSQGCAVDQIVDGIKKTVDFAARHEQIKYLDIGGGLPINYNGAEVNPTFNEFVTSLKRNVPALFEEKRFHIMTEFGRSLVQKSGWIASKVEYTKQSGDKNVATVHAGGNLLVRTAYLPHVWKHQVTVHNSDGSAKQVSGDDELLMYDIAGPLCFSGDYVARDVELPRIEPGDFIVIHDAGGYTYGMYSRYNSKYAPAIYGYDQASGKQKDQEFGIELLKRAETSQDIVAFWRA